MTLGTPGTVSLDLQTRVAARRGTAERYAALSTRLALLMLPGSAENTLQRLITQLEMKRRSLARN